MGGGGGGAPCMFKDLFESGSGLPEAVIRNSMSFMMGRYGSGVNKHPLLACPQAYRVTG